MFIPRLNFANTLIFQLWLCIFCLVPQAAHAVDQMPGKRVALKATIIIKNNGSRPLDPYHFRLTIPADDHPQQRLLRIDYRHHDTYTVHAHDNGVDRYINFSWAVPPYTEITRIVEFILEVSAYDYRKNALRTDGSPHPRFLAPSQYVESDAPEIIAIAREIERAHITPEERIMAAYYYPIKNLRYREMSSNQGALHGLRHGTGDCTEYAALFIALARAMGIPARMTSEFHFTRKKYFSAPNHHSAEVYLGNRWIPVDPNLALDQSLGYGFGIGSANKIILKRGDSWVWSYAIPDVPRGYRKAHVETTISWEVLVED